jgi:aminomethyltransferase
LLSRWFKQRGIAMTAFLPGQLLPERFSDPHREHRAVREAAGLFDFSFMSCIEVAGPGVVDWLNRLQPRDAGGMAVGRILYTLLSRVDGSVAIDATLWRLDHACYWIMTGERSDAHHLGVAAQAAGLPCTDHSDAQAVLAVQGPRSGMVLSALADAPIPGHLPYFSFCRARFDGIDCLLGRLGYTGEFGYELVLPAEHAQGMWQRLMVAGRRHGLHECGLASMDSLRIEAGLMLFRNELSYRVTPGMLNLPARWFGPARLPWVVASDLRRLDSATDAPRLIGLRPLRGELPPADLPAGCPEEWLRMAPGEAVLTSRGKGVSVPGALGLGYAAHCTARPGDTLRLRGSAVPVQVQRLPFYDPMKRRPRRQPLA